MTIQEGPSGMKTNTLRKPTAAEIALTEDLVLEAEETFVNRVGKRGFQ